MTSASHAEGRQFDPGQVEQEDEEAALQAHGVAGGTSVALDGSANATPMDLPAHEFPFASLPGHLPELGVSGAARSLVP